MFPLYTTPQLTSTSLMARNTDNNITVKKCLVSFSSFDIHIHSNPNPNQKGNQLLHKRQP